MARYENDPRPEMAISEPPEELEPVHPAHSVVQDHHLHVPVFFESPFGCRAIGLKAGIVTPPAEEPSVAGKD